MTFAGPPVCDDPSCVNMGKQHYPPHRRGRNPLSAFVAFGLVDALCDVCAQPIVKDDLYVLNVFMRWLHLRCASFTPDEHLTILKATAEEQWPQSVTYPLPDGESTLTVRWAPPLRKGKPHRASIAVPSLCYVWEAKAPGLTSGLPPSDFLPLLFLEDAAKGWSATLRPWSGATGVLGRADGVVDG